MFVELNATLYFWVQVVNSSNVPSAPDSAPTFKVYEGDNSTALVSGTMTGPIDSNTGFYQGMAVTLNNGFERGGTYAVRIAWSVSSSARAKTLHFTVV